MRRLQSYIFAFFAVILFLQQVAPQTQPSNQPSTTSASEGSRPKQEQVNCSNTGTYLNSKGQTVRRPENCSAPPKGATAQCRDGTYSFSQSRRGTCSHHGGVAKWL
jgi:hypothetical protein